jgi:pimeloyl-ACP methyl ester carboxylesterase
MEKDFIKVSDEPEINIHNKFFEALDDRFKNRTIVMIPGWLDTLERRMALVEEFRKIANIVIYEARGFGKSTGPRKRGLYTNPMLLDELQLVLQHHNLHDTDFFIWGTSFSTSLILQYSISTKEPVPKALLVASPVSKFKTQWWFDVLKIMPFFIVKFFVKVVLFFLRRHLKKKQPDDEDNIDYADQRFKEVNMYAQIRVLVEAMHQFDIRGKEKEIKQPMLIFTAEEDWFTDPDISKSFAQYNPKSKAVSLGKTHRVVTTGEAIIREHVTDFIESLG